MLDALLLGGAARTSHPVPTGPENSSCRSRTDTTPRRVPHVDDHRPPAGRRQAPARHALAQPVSRRCGGACRAILLRHAAGKAALAPLLSAPNGSQSRSTLRSSSAARRWSGSRACSRARPRPTSGVELFAKLEAFNPGGSVKDRIGVAMIEAAEAEGRIEPGRTTIVEATSGNTGIALAFVCAAKGYELVLTLPQGMSRERESLLRLYGARVDITESLGGMGEAVEAARAMAQRAGRVPARPVLQPRQPRGPPAHHRARDRARARRPRRRARRGRRHRRHDHRRRRVPARARQPASCASSRSSRAARRCSRAARRARTASRASAPASCRRCSTAS